MAAARILARYKLTKVTMHLASSWACSGIGAETQHASEQLTRENLRSRGVAQNVRKVKIRKNQTIKQQHVANDDDFNKNRVGSPKGP